MAHAFLVSVGTSGNMLPFLGLGAHLARGGWSVTLAGSRYTRSAAERLGMNFIELETPSAQRKHDPDNRPTKTGKILKQLVDEANDFTGHVFRLIADHCPRRDSVLVAQGWLFGARIARDVLQIPYLSVHLQPMLFRTALDQRGAPPWLMRGVHRVIDWLVDRALVREINKLQHEHGLKPVHRLLEQWWYSPDGAIGCFPDWYSSLQPDWPPSARLVGFPLFDELEPYTASEELEQFLSAGDPPIAFTQASLVKDAHSYFEASIAAARQLGRRSLLLTGHKDQLPDPLPPDAGYFGYIPLSAVLGRCAAIVHHGGLGSISQALAAGLPQVVAPRLLDQPDNARRLLKLGVARKIRPKDYDRPSVVRALSDLLSDPQVAIACRDYASRMKGMDAFGAIENIMKTLVATTSVHSGQ